MLLLAIARVNSFSSKQRKQPRRTPESSPIYYASEEFQGRHNSRQSHRRSICMDQLALHYLERCT